MGRRRIDRTALVDAVTAIQRERPKTTLTVAVKILAQRDPQYSGLLKDPSRKRSLEVRICEWRARERSRLWEEELARRRLDQQVLAAAMASKRARVPAPSESPDMVRYQQEQARLRLDQEFVAVLHHKPSGF